MTEEQISDQVEQLENCRESPKLILSQEYHLSSKSSISNKPKKMEEEFKRTEEESKWEVLFAELITRTRKHSSDIAEVSDNRSLNRYQDVLPYNKTRVKLTRCAKSTDYINANLVTVPKAARQYILTQGPLPETLPHFWLMIWEQKSNVIVMLNKCIEMEDFVKCEQYWPDEIGNKLTYDEVSLSVTLKKVEVKKHYTVRHMELHDSETGKTRSIVQFQYTAWPDHGQPNSPTSFLRLLAAIRKSGGLDKMDEPTIVHCSAGIGRSGTFCLIDSVLSMIENQGSTEGIDIINTLLEMRDYRMGLIQSPVQLRFAYMSIIYGVKILEKAKKLHPHVSSMTAAAQQQNNKLNGSAGSQQTNGKISRRNKRKQTGSVAQSPSSLNVFNKHLLVEALDNIDSDSADNLFEESMKQLPSLKKARNMTTDSSDESFMDQLYQFARDSTKNILNSTNDEGEPSDPQIIARQRAQMLPINSLLTESTISQKDDLQQAASVAMSQGADSVLVRRRERELRNQKLAEKTQEIKNRMKAEDIKRQRQAQRIALLRKTAIISGLAVMVSSLAYMYINSS